MLRNSIKTAQSSRSFFSKLFKSEPKPLPTRERRMVDNEFGKYEAVELWYVSPRREIPSHIKTPIYYNSLRQEKVPKEPEIKNANEIAKMRESCKLAKKILNSIGPMVKPGVTTDSIDEQVHELIINNGAYPSPFRYLRFPKSICTSINNIACHGIPDNRPLIEGDILNIDVTVYLNGFHGDCSDMFTVGEVDSEALRLIQTTKDCLDIAINICKPGEEICKIGKVIMEHANDNGFVVIPCFAGHGIGSYFHGPPDIFHIENDIPGIMMPGMTFTIEPVLTQGGIQVKILNDGWSAATVDDARTAQVEHTILITNEGCDILTC